MEQVLRSKARLESSQDNGVASQASSLIKDIHFYGDDHSVPAEMILLLDVVSGKVMALGVLVGLIMCFVHFSMLKKQPFLI